jgi:hypothetical protein
MQTATSYERRRIIDAAKKEQFCALIRESYSLEESAETLDVSLRTVQRERQRDEAFDREIRSAQESHPDPLRLMEAAARTHWRAAAWMLERERPERFGRRPANTARKHQVEAALDFVLEAALAATPAEQRAAFYQPVLAAVEQAFQQCFPQVDRCNSASSKKCNFRVTPLADEAARQLSEQAAAACSPAAEEAIAHLSPKIAEATLGDEKPSPAKPIATKPIEAEAITTPPSNAALCKRSTISDAHSRSPAMQLSPKMQQTTVSDATPTDETTANAPLIAVPFATPAFSNPGLSPPREHKLKSPDAHERQRERQVAKRKKAAKKRSAASRRRNAA